MIDKPANPKDKDDGPFPASTFPKEIFPRRIFPWMGGDDDEENENVSSENQRLPK